ncbi:hypothetical protein Tco_1105353 [Tanacetum coccineum]
MLRGKSSWYGQGVRNSSRWNSLFHGTRPDETTAKIIKIRSRMQAARDRQKSYDAVRRKPLEFAVGDKVMLKVSPWKGVICFGKRVKFNPKYIRPFKILTKVGPVAYRLELPKELSGCSNQGGGCEKRGGGGFSNSGGGCEKRGGGDTLDGPGGQLSTVETYDWLRHGSTYREDGSKHGGSVDPWWLKTDKGGFPAN